MATLKYSRQRESIREFVMNSREHPTADTVYAGIKAEFPNISLGTVYRNLSLLSDIGEIQKLSTGIGPDRFDGNPALHYHFICKFFQQLICFCNIDTAASEDQWFLC